MLRTPIFDSDFDCYKSSGYTSSPSPAANRWMNRHFSTQTAAGAKIWTGILGTPMQQQFGFPFMSWGPLTPIGGLSCVLFADFCFQTASAPGKCARFVVLICFWRYKQLCWKAYMRFAVFLFPQTCTVSVLHNGWGGIGGSVHVPYTCTHTHTECRCYATHGGEVPWISIDTVTARPGQTWKDRTETKNGGKHGKWRTTNLKV